MAAVFLDITAINAFGFNAHFENLRMGHISGMTSTLWALNGNASAFGLFYFWIKICALFLLVDGRQVLPSRFQMPLSWTPPTLRTFRKTHHIRRIANLGAVLLRCLDFVVGNGQCCGFIYELFLAYLPQQTHFLT